MDVFDHCCFQITSLSDFSVCRSRFRFINQIMRVVQEIRKLQINQNQVLLNLWSRTGRRRRASTVSTLWERSAGRWLLTVNHSQLKQNSSNQRNSCQSKNRNQVQYYPTNNELSFNTVVTCNMKQNIILFLNVVFVYFNERFRR